MPSQEEAGEAFRALHAGPLFVIPNPWDAGSARVLAALGFSALASTSSGFAFTLGRLDGDASLDAVVAHTKALVAATGLPVSVDLENGYGADPQSAARAILRVAEAGAVGASIEDYDPASGIYELSHATERIAAAAEAAATLPFPFTLTARAENHIRGSSDLSDTIARLQAFEGVGADVLYAPGLASAEQVSELCAAVSGPVNVLAWRELSMAAIEAAGARRVSLGGSLTWAAVDAMVAVAQAIRDDGDFSGLRPSPPLPDWFA